MTRLNTAYSRIASKGTLYVQRGFPIQVKLIRMALQLLRAGGSGCAAELAQLSPADAVGAAEEDEDLFMFPNTDAGWFATVGVSS